MVSRHWVLYHSLFRVPWRSLVPETATYAPPPPTIKLCWLQTPSSNCRAAYNGCEELGPHRHLCEIPCHSARCWWGPTGPLCTLAPWQPFFTSTSPLATAVVSANRKEGWGGRSLGAASPLILGLTCLPTSKRPSPVPPFPGWCWGSRKKKLVSVFSSKKKYFHIPLYVLTFVKNHTTKIMLKMYRIQVAAWGLWS